MSDPIKTGPAPFDAKTSLTYEVDQVVVSRIRPTIDGEVGDWIDYNNWQAAKDAAEGGKRLAEEAGLTTGITMLRSFDIEAKLAKARLERQEAKDTIDYHNKRADRAQENAVRYRERAAAIELQAKQKFAEAERLALSASAMGRGTAFETSVKSAGTDQ